MNLLIREVLLDGKKTNIQVEGDRITAIGEKAKSKTGMVIDGGGKAAIPGLINTHTHAAMTLLRGYADDLHLQEWLSKHIWPVEAKMTEDDVYWGAKLACLEMVKSGTTCFSDMYWHSPKTMKAADESGLRSVISSVFIDKSSPEKAPGQRADAERLIKESKKGSRTRISLGPHAMYTVTEESMRWVKECSDKYDAIVHFHLSETKKEVEDCVDLHGKRPVEYLEEIGFLGPNLVCAHCVWLSKNEMEILAKHGVKIAHCPTSNMKLSVGEALDYNALRKAGVTVSLGTDGCSSNNNLDMFESMKFAALLQKMRLNDPTALPAKAALDMATVEGAKALKLDAGILAEGRLADIVLIDLKNPQMTPLHNLASNLVYAANGSCVDTVICDGEILMEDRIVKGEEEITEKAGKAAEALASRAKGS